MSKALGTEHQAILEATQLSVEPADYLDYFMTQVKKVADKHQHQMMRYSCIDAMVLAEGIRAMTSLPVPEEFDFLPAQQCFNNSALLANDLLKSGLQVTYCEGMALTSKVDLPFLHAWVLVKGGVIDPTWTGRGDRPCGIAYRGIPFDIDFVNAFTRKHNSASMLDAWQARFPLLRKRPPKGYRHKDHPLKMVRETGVEPA